MKTFIGTENGWLLYEVCRNGQYVIAICSASTGREEMLATTEKTARQWANLHKH